MPNSQYRELLHDRGICVIIPTYNNVGTIAEVVSRTLAICNDVIVVNDGSNDGTEKILREMNNITLVDYEKNAGKGTALKRGFKKAIEMGFAYAITLDADGQHYPEDIPSFLDANIKFPGCLIVGQRRMSGANRTLGSRFANSFSNFWFCLQTLHYLRDTQSGFRLYPLHKLHGLSLLTSRYESELELLVFSSWHGVKIVPIDINVYYPPLEERISHFRPARDFLRISVLNTCLCVLALCYGLPCAVLRWGYILFITFFALFVYLFGSLFVVTPFAFFNKVFGGSVANLHRLVTLFSRLVLRLLSVFCARTEIINNVQEDFSKPAVVICNHQSHLDLMAVLSVTDRMILLTNDWVWRSPFFGYIVRNSDYYPVSEGIDKYLPELKSLVKRGYSIMVFPEGTRSKDCSIQRFHKGAFHIAKELGLDIVPMILYGAGRALPKKGWYLRRWPIVLTICRRFKHEELRLLGNNDRELCKWFRKYYQEHFAKICNKIDNNV